MAEQAVFALNGATLSSGNQIAISLYFPQNDPQFATNPVLQRLGQYIGQDHVSFDASSFQPWTSTQPGHQALPLNSAIFGSNPPPVQANPAANPSDTLSLHTSEWQPVEPVDQCTICLADMEKEGGACRQLNLCCHRFHSECLNQMLKTSPSPFLQCPLCKKVHGVRTGNRPLTGSMIHQIENSSLPGFEGSGTISICFHFQSGLQGPEHPSPGQPYIADGFPRVAYLPDTPDGCRALHGLYLAWEQRLLFTVGTSMSSGFSNRVTWNDIHLKTQKIGSEHGYPDPNFLANLMQELAGFGITEAEIGAHMTAHPNLRTRDKF